jgi:acetyl-CoA carboxylase carboxyltransferase component
VSWDEEIRELQRRRRLAQAQGGKAAIARQHAKGRLTIRERIDALLDPGSFEEQGRATAIPEYDDQDALQGFVPANYVVGFGRIHGRRVAVGGEDFTLKGGSPNAAGLRKSIYAEHMACQYRVPLIRLLEGGGGSVRGSGRRHPRAGGTVGEPVYAEPRFRIIADALGQVPVASAALGAVAGFPAGRLVASHFSVMTRHTAQVLIGGPALVERALGVRLSKEQLGGATVHAISGVVDNLAEDEHDALRQIRRFLSYLPSHVGECAPRVASDDDPERMEPELLDAVPRDGNSPFDMRAIVEMVVDRDSLFEIGATYGPSQICALARLDGQPVAVLANDCRHYAGAMTAEAAQKYRRFVELADTFHLPVVNFVDQPGFMIGPEAERSGTIRYGMAAVAAAVQATVPWASIQVHKGFGVATAAHYGPDAYVLAWPSVESGALPLEGGVAVAFHREIAAAENPDAKRRELEAALRANRSPFARAESFAVHELIDPRETRPMLCGWVERIQPRLETLTGPVRFGFRP